MPRGRGRYNKKKDKKHTSRAAGSQTFTRWWRQPPVNAELETDGGTVTLRLAGRIDNDMLARADELLQKASPEAEWRLELSDVSRVDPAGAAGMVKLARRVRDAGGSVHIDAASDEVKRANLRYGLEELLQAPPGGGPRTQGGLEGMGEQLFAFGTAAVDFTVLVYDAAYWAFIAPFSGRGFEGGELLRRVTRNGFYAVAIMSLVAALFGLVLSVNGAYLLEKWGQNRLIADMIGLGITREIAPVMVGIMLAARSGAALAAEIGTMKVREEINAMWVMGMNPARFLVIPNVLALTLVAPVLVLLTSAVGIVSSFLITTLAFGVSPTIYINRLINAVVLQDLITGITKGAVFGLVVAFVACWFGMAVEGSAEEVGTCTTRTVVWSIVLVIVGDGLFSTGLYLLG